MMSYPDYTHVNQQLPWINDWCHAIGLHIARHRSDVWLHAVVRGPPRTAHYEGYAKARTVRGTANIPVTNDKGEMLALLGFEQPELTLEALRRATTDRTACSIMCSTRLFKPSMVVNTAGGKFGGCSQLCSYAREMWGNVVGVIKEGDDHQHIAQLKFVHGVIERRFPEVVNAKEAFSEHERMLGQLEETVWGPSLSIPTDGGERRDLIHEHTRWKRFLELRGLQPLCATDPAAALEDWVRFRKDGSHDWSLSHCSYL